MLIALVLAGVYAAKRFQSVSFRAYTWLSAVEMVQDAPVTGTGPGSFKIIYPAYRRPQIFYIENSHNTETQHAENEYLEQWATTGTVGLAVFLWMIVFVLVCAARNLKRGAQSAERTPALQERSWYLLGYTGAFFGLLAHAFVDISLRFASSGLFFAVFISVSHSYIFLAKGFSTSTFFLCSKSSFVISKCIWENEAFTTRSISSLLNNSL